MKNLLVLVLFIYCFVNDISAQIKYGTQPTDSTQLITLDFKNKVLNFDDHLKIKKGEFIRVKVINYNPLVYKVNIDNRDSSVAQPNDAGFLGMFLSPDKFTSALGGLINIIGTPPDVVTQMSLKTEFTTKINPINKIIDPNIVPNNLLDKYLIDAKNKIDSITYLKNNIENTFDKIYKYYGQLQKPNLNCAELNLTQIQSKANEFDVALKLHLQESRKISTEILDSATNFSFRCAPLNYLINSDSLLKAKQKYIDNFYIAAIIDLNNLDTSISYKKINEMYAAFIKLSQNDACYTSLPIYINDDIKVLNISLTPVEANSNLPSYQTSFSIPKYQPKIWGVTGGIFATGLHNEIYVNKRKLNDTTYNLIGDGQGKSQIGVNALAYVAHQLGNKANYIGASFGAGMSLEAKPKPRVLLGCSFITGDRNKILFSVGFTGGFVSTLSDAFSTTANYITPAQNYQKDIIKWSGFFSINYSFLNNK